MEATKAEDNKLTDGDFQWISQNFVDLTQTENPNIKNIWFNCKYQKNEAVLKYFSLFEEKSLDSTLNFVQNQIDEWDHPHIAKIFDYDFTEKDPYSYRFVICQEKGLFSLRDELDKKDRLKPKECRNLIHQLATALVYAKDKFKATHGNIKPSNVIKFNAGEEMYKLSEFGSDEVVLGKETEMLAKAPDLTQSEFLAPEYRRTGKKAWRSELNPMLMMFTLWVFWH